MKFADPKNDLAFKKIFGNENHKDILISFLNSILDFKDEKKIKSVTILNSHQAPKIEELKETILDIRATNEKNETFIVEMQRKDLNNFQKRSLYYTSKAYVQQLDKNQDYSTLKKVYFIGIVNFKMFESKNYLTKHLIVNQENGKQELKDFEFIFIELPKFKIRKNQINKLNTVIEKWIWFLKHTQKLDLIPKEFENIKEFEDAFLIATQYKWSKKDIEIYDYMTLKEYDEINAIETSYGKGKIAGKAEGLEQGLEAEKIKIAKTSLDVLDIDIVSLKTGLTIEEIKNLS